VRCAILPSKRSAFVGGRWVPVDPIYPGPAAAILGNEEVPAWWILACDRKAECVGIHHPDRWTHSQAPTNCGEIVIDKAIYRVSEHPLSDREIGLHMLGISAHDEKQAA
jgi:hypothetical protein